MNWGLEDFIVVSALLLTTGFACYIVNRKVRNNTYRAFIILGVICAMLWIYAELAVGIFTNWGS
jgi:uncharacterized BrkB/YihY/UPF0761 family membrane protein